MCQKNFLFYFIAISGYFPTFTVMHTYYTYRSAKALTNALDRLMVAIPLKSLEEDHTLLCEYRRCCELLGYDPSMTSWHNVEAANVATCETTAPEVGVDYFPLFQMLQPSEHGVSPQ